MIQAHLTDQFCCWLAQDRYYRDPGPELRGQINYDHPDSIDFDLMARHLTELRNGQDIAVPQYDFTRHMRLPASTEFPCRPVVIVDGILILSQPQIRPLLDFSFFIETQEELRFQRRLQRDIRERGRTPEGVQDQFYRQVKPMHDLFVAPSRQFADKVISGERSFGPAINEIVYGLTNRSGEATQNP